MNYTPTRGLMAGRALAGGRLAEHPERGILFPRALLPDGRHQDVLIALSRHPEIAPILAEEDARRATEQALIASRCLECAGA